MTKVARKWKEVKRGFRFLERVMRRLRAKKSMAATTKEVLYVELAQIVILMCMIRLLDSYFFSLEEQRKSN